MARILYTLPPDSGRRKRKRSLRRLLTPKGVFFFFVLIAAAASAIFGIRHPYARIAKIDVEGAQAVSADEIRVKAAALLSGSYAFVLPKDFFGFVSTSAIKKSLEKDFLGLAEAEVAKEFPDTLRVSVRERTPWGIACREASSEFGERSPEKEQTTPNFQLPTSNCFYIDPTGFAYEPAPQTFGSLVRKVITDSPAALGTFISDASMMDFLKAAGEGAEKILGFPIVEYQLSSAIPNDVRLKTAEGFFLILTQESNVSESLQVLERVLREEIKEKRSRLDYIDVRFGNKLFYKIRE